MNQIGETSVLWGDVHNHCSISSQVLLEAEGSRSTRIRGAVNTLRIDTTVGKLLESGFGAPERDQSVLFYTALPESRYAVNLSCALVSPVFFGENGNCAE